MEPKPGNLLAQKTQIVIQADVRESASKISQILAQEYGVRILRTTLKIGDYMIDERIVVERKTIQDFAQSIIDGRLFKQAATMKNSFESPLFIIEGNPSFIPGDIHPHATQGALVSIALTWQISVLFAKDERDTALFLWLISNQRLTFSSELSYRTG